MKTFPPFLRASLFVIVTLLVPPLAEATTITVTSTANAGGSCPGAPCTLRQAITTATPGDTIDFNLPVDSVISLTSGARSQS